MILMAGQLVPDNQIDTKRGNLCQVPSFCISLAVNYLSTPQAFRGYMVTNFASFWIDSPWECGGRWMEEKVTKCSQIWGGVQKQDFVKCLKINNLQSLVVPRTGLEPVQPFRPRDFKSLVSTIPPPRPGRCLNRQAPRERKYSYFPGFPTIWRHGNRLIPRSARRPWRTSLRPR